MKSPFAILNALSCRIVVTTMVLAAGSLQAQEQAPPIPARTAEEVLAANKDAGKKDAGRKVVRNSYFKSNEGAPAKPSLQPNQPPPTAPSQIHNFPPKNAANGSFQKSQPATIQNPFVQQSKPGIQQVPRPRQTTTRSPTIAPPQKYPTTKFNGFQESQVNTNVDSSFRIEQNELLNEFLNEPVPLPSAGQSPTSPTRDPNQVRDDDSRFTEQTSDSLSVTIQTAPELDAMDSIAPGSNQFESRPNDSNTFERNGVSEFNQSSPRQQIPRRTVNAEPQTSAGTGSSSASWKSDVGNEPVSSLNEPTSSIESAKPTFRQASSRRPGRQPTASTKVEPKKSKEKSTNKQVGTTDFTLASQPTNGDQFSHEPPVVDASAVNVEPMVGDFAPTPIDPHQYYDAGTERMVYEGKTLNANRRPLIELGKPWYQLGQIAPSKTWLGAHNPVNEQFLIYGDYRMAYANAKNANRDNTSQVAFEWNMNFDLRLTGTERITAFVAPLDRGANNTRWLTDDDQFIDQLDFDVNFGMLEGDLGAIVGGLTGQTMPFDLPFAAGVMPMLVQNGVWMEDAITGIAFTSPARNSPMFDISNVDLTFFAAYDEIESPAFEGNNSAAKMYGILGFIESFGGYWETDYAYIEDRDITRDRSYHNIGLAFTRRYGRYISNSTRIIINAGQSTRFGPGTADGVLLLSENSLTTSKPNSFVPYFNFWAGFDRPQSAARAGAAGGVLRNTGILFESDGMTGFPTLDASANDTTGGAIGLNILTPDWDQQLVVEFAFLKTMGNDATRIARGDQAGLGARYQLPLSNSWILRSDVMYGFFDNTSDVHGARMELRHKF